MSHIPSHAMPHAKPTDDHDTPAKADETATATVAKAAETVSDTAAKSAASVSESASKAAATVAESSSKAAEAISDSAGKAAERATAAVKGNPKTAIAIGVAIIAGIAAAIAAPAVLARGKDEPSKKAPRKTPAKGK